MRINTSASRNTREHQLQQQQQQQQRRPRRIALDLFSPILRNLNSEVKAKEPNSNGLGVFSKDFSGNFDPTALTSINEEMPVASQNYQFLNFDAQAVPPPPPPPPPTPPTTMLADTQYSGYFEGLLNLEELGFGNGFSEMPLSSGEAWPTIDENYIVGNWSPISEQGNICQNTPSFSPLYSPSGVGTTFEPPSTAGSYNMEEMNMENFRNKLIQFVEAHFPTIQPQTRRRPHTAPQVQVGLNAYLPSPNLGTDLSQYLPSNLWWNNQVQDNVQLMQQSPISPRQDMGLNPLNNSYIPNNVIEHDSKNACMNYPSIDGQINNRVQVNTVRRNKRRIENIQVPSQFAAYAISNALNLNNNNNNNNISSKVSSIVNEAPVQFNQEIATPITPADYKQVASATAPPNREIWPQKWEDLMARINAYVQQPDFSFSKAVELGIPGLTSEARNAALLAAIWKNKLASIAAANKTGDDIRAFTDDMHPSMFRPRDPNQFILFRKYALPYWQRTHPEASTQELSVLLGSAWTSLSIDNQSIWKEFAIHVKKENDKLYLGVPGRFRMTKARKAAIEEEKRQKALAAAEATQTWSLEVQKGKVGGRSGVELRSKQRRNKKSPY